MSFPLGEGDLASQHWQVAYYALDFRTDIETPVFYFPNREASSTEHVAQRASHAKGIEAISSQRAPGESGRKHAGVHNSAAAHLDASEKNTSGKHTIVVVDRDKRLVRKSVPNRPE